MTRNIYVKNDYTEQSTGDVITGGFVINNTDWTDEQCNAEYGENNWREIPPKPKDVDEKFAEWNDKQSLWEENLNLYTAKMKKADSQANWQEVEQWAIKQLTAKDNTTKWYKTCEKEKVKARNKALKFDKDNGV